LFSSLPPNLLSAFGNFPSSPDGRRVRQAFHRGLSEFPTYVNFKIVIALMISISTPPAKPRKGRFLGSADCPEHLIKVLITKYAKKGK
jgi:hypothetical protein